MSPWRSILKLPHRLNDAMDAHHCTACNSIVVWRHVSFTFHVHGLTWRMRTSTTSLAVGRVSGSLAMHRVMRSDRPSGHSCGTCLSTRSKA